MSILSYDQIINLSIVQQFYYLAWRLFGVNIAIISPDRMHSLAINGKDGWSPFCIRLRQTGGETHCVECDRRHAEQVEQQRFPLRYTCWAGLREVIVPIIVDNEILAYIQCGQVLDNPPTREDWQATRKILTEFGFDCEPLEPLFMRQRVVPVQTQEDLMTLLELFGNYIADSQHRILLADASLRSRTEERAFSYLRNHYTDPITLDDVANAACTSKRNLTRIFHANTGITVLNAIQDMRIEKAGALLREGDKTCTQIASECGFGSIQQFNRVFKKIKKCTPQEWQRQHAG
jgi:AraC-like DNA-binding protein/ligand-binding sensor protein